ncbi:MAG TPA: hypothetical protein VFS05_11960 [Gemmatimonadaceae bacterium]|nr:hypothetical protein [Gemmatimonadaceae bacterium]
MVAGREEYDLLIAMGLGLMVGVGVTLLLRRGPKGRPATMMARAAGRGGLRGARWAARRGQELVDELPLEQIGDTLGDYITTAREAIDDTISRELKDLRKAVRRQRKRLRL